MLTPESRKSIGQDEKELSAPLRIRLVIADDHALVRDGMRSFVRARPDFVLVGEAANGSEAVTLCRESRPDVCLLDMIMPVMTGLDAIAPIKQASPETQVLVLTSFNDDQYILPAIEAGAVGFLLKDAAPEELATAIRRAAAQESTFSPAVATRLARTLQRRNIDPAFPAVPPVPAIGLPSGVTVQTLIASLTPREQEVLRHLAQGYTNAQIADALFLGETTIKSHVSNILNKLQLTDRTQAAVFAWRHHLI